MYMACANSYVYDYSEDEEGHAWCSLFDNDDIIVNTFLRLFINVFVKIKCLINYLKYIFL